VVILFDEDTFTMIDKNNNGKVMFKGFLDGKMYKFNVTIVPPNKQINSYEANAMSTIFYDLQLWHEQCVLLSYVAIK
jgi:hypothetical protein